jgi:phage baseplate assembly protein W
MANGLTYGISFPFRQSEKGNYLNLTDDSDEEIRTSLLHLILTKRGSRYYLPDFGTNIYSFIFDPLDGQTFDAIKDDIKTQVEKYIPNLTINSITVTPYLETEEGIGELDYELLGKTSIHRIPGANTQEYTAKLKINYTNENSTFGTREFVIINI